MCVVKERRVVSGWLKIKKIITMVYHGGAESTYTMVDHGGVESVPPDLPFNFTEMKFMTRRGGVQFPPRALVLRKLLLIDSTERPF